MNEGQPLNNGENHNHFSLMRRPSSALEKAAPGAKRILSGMVLDMLATVWKAPPLKIVHVDDEYWLLEMIEMEIRKLAKEHRWLNEVRFKQFQDGESAWQELLREEPDLLITDMVRGDSLKRGQKFYMRGFEMLPLLAERKVRYPILVASGFVEEKKVRLLAGPGLNISFLKKPFTSEQLYEELSKLLSSQLQFRNGRPDKTSSPRIIVVDDDPSFLDLLEGIIRDHFKDAIVLKFDKGEQAWLELLRTPPDFLITDLERADKMNGWEMIPLLAERKVKWPVMLLTGSTKGQELHQKVTLALNGKDDILLGKIQSGEFKDEDLQDQTPSGGVQNLLRRVSPLLSITFLAKPFTVENFIKILEAGLKSHRRL